MSDDLSMLKSRLKIMETVTAECRKVVEDDGMLYILWGSLAVIASGLTYAVFALALPVWIVAVIWGLIFCGIGLVITLRHISRMEKRARTFGATILARMWTGACLVMFTILGLSFVPNVPWQLISFVPFSLGIIYFPLAVLLDWKPFYLFAVLWILFGAATLFVSPNIAPLVLDIAIVCCEILPGILLKLRASRLRATELREAEHE